MKIENLDVELKDMEGNQIPEQKKDGKVEYLTLRKLIIAVLRTEKILNDDRTGLITVNNKSEDDKLNDFNLGWKISQAGKTVDLNVKNEISRIIDLAHYLDTEKYGALLAHLNK